MPHAEHNRAVFACLHLRRACRGPSVLASTHVRLGSSVPRICCRRFSAGRAHRRSAKRWVELQQVHETRGQETVAQGQETSLYDRASRSRASTDGIGKQEINGMPRKLAVAFGTIGLVAGALMPGAPVQAQGVKAGVLTCNVSSGFGFIFGSSKSVNCSFSPPGGPPQHYVGSIGRRQCSGRRIGEHDLAAAGQHRRQHRPQYRRRRRRADPNFPAGIISARWLRPAGGLRGEVSRAGEP